MTFAAGSPEVGHGDAATSDAVMDFVLGPLRDVADPDPEVAQAAAVEAALEALDPPTRRGGKRSERARERARWAEQAEPADVVSAYVATAPGERAQLILDVVRERAPEWRAAWDAAAEPVAGLVRAALAWKQSVSVADSGRWDAETTAARLLDDAHAELRAAAAAAPDDIAPLVLAQAMLAPPQHGRADLDRLAAAWERVDPFDVEAQRGWLECILRGGFGTQQEAMERLEYLAAEAPSGHEVLGAVAAGLCLLDGRDLAEGITPAWEEGSRRRAVLALAYARGPQDPAWQPSDDAGFVRNCFAYGLACSDDPRAWDEFAALRGFWTPFPWELIDPDPLTGYLESRAWAAQAAGTLGV